MAVVECLRCGAAFETRRGAKWCSSTCRARASEEGASVAEKRSEALRLDLSPKQARCLALLRANREAGVSTGMFVRAGCGTRFGARLHELAALGFVITSHRQHQGSYLYLLISEPDAGRGATVDSRSPSGAVSGTDNPGARLFETTANAALEDVA